MPDPADISPNTTPQPRDSLLPDQNQETQLNLTVKLEPGARLRLTLETRAADGHVVHRRLLDTTAGDGSVAVTVEISKPGEAGPAPVEQLRHRLFQEIQHTPAASASAAREAVSVLRQRLSQGFQPASAAGAQTAPPLLRTFETLIRRAGWGFALALAVYLVTRLVALADYPMYFFTDEAIQTLLASDLLRNGLRSENHEFLPTFFYNVYQYNLSVSVYLQVLPTLLFGKAVEMTRGVSVLFSLLPAVCSGLAMRQFFNSRYSWLAVLVLSITPAWFLHSRTAFETSLAVSFYAAFLYFYLRYRSDHPRSLYPAIVFAALAFYSYSPAQMVVAVTAILLFFSDLRYNLRLARRVVQNGVGLGLLVALPYVRFLVEHPDANAAHLKQINSYWATQIPLLDKVGRYIGDYLSGLNPQYWFFNDTIDFSRHLMGNYGNLLVFSLPFIAWGLVITLKNLRSPAYRVLLISVLASPSGAALAGIGIPRALFMVIPAAILGALGLESALEGLLRRWQSWRRAAAAGVFVLLAGFNFFLLADALTNGRTWSVDYGLNGMQYGGVQVFGEIDRLHQQSPELNFDLSSTWANGTDNLRRFFLPPEFPIQMYSIDSYLNKQQPIDPKTLFVLPANEYQRAVDSAKFSDINVVETLPWPNGEAGFYFFTMRYVDNIDAILSEEAAQRLSLQEAIVDVGGEMLQVHYSRLDMGPIDKLFDGDLTSLIRTEAANPLKLEIDFPAPHRLNGFTLRIGSNPTTLDVSVNVAGEAAPRTYHQEQPAGAIQRDMTVDFGEPLQVTSLSIQQKNTLNSEPAHVHLWEVIWK